DQWTIPFLPVGGSREFDIQAQVKPATPPGTIQRNMALVEDLVGHSASIFEDTVLALKDVMTASIDDSPDPAQPTDLVEYTLSFGNASTTDLGNVVVTAWHSPELQFFSASQPPTVIAPVPQWNIGTLAAGSAQQILLTLAPVSPMAPGSIAQV